MAEVIELQRALLSRQNGDGGWGYQKTTSWVEPTALALLALEACGYLGDAHERGSVWLLNCQRADGGWSPCPSVPMSTSVTSVAALALSRPNPTGPYRKAIQWVIAHTRPDPGPLERLQFWFRNIPLTEATAGGSPWFPGTAAWIAPTAMAVLTLSDADRRGSTVSNEYVRRAQAYILSRRCPDGGWNHGGNPYRSDGATSYPEMTGMALLALQGIEASLLAKSLAQAERMIQSPESSEGQSWLELALTRHGRTHNPQVPNLPWHTTRDLALRLLAVTAASPTNRMRLRTAS